ncbi:MAG: LOW QUALITY PROTEIN: uncharacterized protein KVP18_003788 [Porospora cf. gigantea A]|uniref:uncharacterized protein n=1 Tax=Porospora cf. gigantea A TaxID=2853593 RepID=UPI003559EC13|nr:MAG: LOW QUALITY PROTEIN: hypothetical protein KVP18_003788 [Porospora cf. gigantea A]
MEKCLGGELHSWVHTAYAGGKSISEDTVVSIALQMCSALAYLHSHHVVHRDIKLENFLIERPLKDDTADVRPRIKLIDFGLARYWRPTDGSMARQCGSLSHIAPELLNGEGYGIKVDMWALGTCVYGMLCGVPPFFGSTRDALEKKIRTGAFAAMTGPRWNRVSPQCKDFIKRLLTVDPDNRMAAQDALKHPWFLNARPSMPRVISLPRLAAPARVPGRLSGSASGLGLMGQGRMSGSPSFHSLRKASPRSSPNLVSFAIKTFLNADAADRALRRLFACFLTTKEIDEDIISLFNGFDIDHDGIINQTNWMEASKQFVPELTSKQMERCFDTMLETFNLVASVNNHQRRLPAEPQSELTDDTHGTPHRGQRHNPAFESMKFVSPLEYEVSFSEFISPFVPHIVAHLDCADEDEDRATTRSLCREVFDRLSGGLHTLKIDGNDHFVIRSLSRFQKQPGPMLEFEDFYEGVLHDFHALHSL